MRAVAHFRPSSTESSQSGNTIWITRSATPAPRLDKRAGEVGPVQNPGSLTFAAAICLRHLARASTPLPSGRRSLPPGRVPRHLVCLHRRWHRDSTRKGSGKLARPSVQPGAIARVDGVAGGCWVWVASGYFGLFAQVFLLDSQHCLPRAALRAQWLVQ